MGVKKPYVLGVVNSKGGAGKSTLVIQLAIAFAKKMNMKVLVVDVDDQGSSINWFERYRPDDRNGISVMHVSSKYLKSRLKPMAKGYDIVVIDAKGSRDKKIGDVVATDVIVNSDFTVVPLVPAVLDEMAMDDFMNDVIVPLAEVKEINLGVLLNRVKGIRSAKMYRKYLRDLDLPCFDAEVNEVAVIANGLAAGQACFEHDSKDKGTITFLAFFKELCTHLGMKKNAKKATSNKRKKSSTPKKRKGSRSENRA